MSTKVCKELMEKLIKELEPAGLVAINADGDYLSKSLPIELYINPDNCIVVLGTQVLKMIESGVVDRLKVYNMNRPHKFITIEMECGPVYLNAHDTITYKDPGLTKPSDEISLKDMTERALKMLEEIQTIIAELKLK